MLCKNTFEKISEIDIMDDKFLIADSVTLYYTLLSIVSYKSNT